MRIWLDFWGGAKRQVSGTLECRESGGRSKAGYELFSSDADAAIVSSGVAQAAPRIHAADFVPTGRYGREKNADSGPTGNLPYRAGQARERRWGAIVPTASASMSIGSPNDALLLADTPVHRGHIPDTL
jgi:hypothetical protein